MVGGTLLRGDARDTPNTPPCFAFVHVYDYSL